MTATPCPCCGTPTPDAYVCQRCGSALAGALREAAGHAEDAPTVVARLTRYGGAGGGARAAEPEAATVTPANRRNPVTAFGWAASVERPRAGALIAEPMPYDPDAADRLDAITNTIGTWARDLGTDATNLAEAARWLADHVDWLRHGPAGAEAFTELHDACADLRRLVDSPATDRLVGVCDCSRVLYAMPWHTAVECPAPCGARWAVADGLAILRRHVDDRLFTAAEAAPLAVRLVSEERSTEQVRKLINKWGERGELAAKGGVWREPNAAELKKDRDHPMVAERLYRFGDVAERLARTQRREPRDREGAAA
jgi:hypothetical protein